MPQVGRRPAPEKKPPPKPKPAPIYTSEAGLTGSSQQQKAGTGKVVKQVAATSAGGTASAIINSKRAAVRKAGTGGITKRQEVNVQSDSKRLASAVKTGASKTASQKANADRFGFKAPTGDRQRRKFGGTATGGGGGGGSVGDGFRAGGGGNLGKPDVSGSGGDGGRLSGAFKDRNLVGSSNDITEFDGSQFSGGGFDETGNGGGGSGSSLAGRESVGLLNLDKNQSVEEAVYGVQKKGRKVARARGE